MSSEMPVSANWMNGRLRGHENHPFPSAKPGGVWQATRYSQSVCFRHSSARAGEFILQPLEELLIRSASDGSREIQAAPPTGLP